MKIVIIAYNLNTPKCEFSELHQEDTRYVLVATEFSYGHFSESNRKFFDETHIIQEGKIDLLLEKIAPYVQSEGKENISFICSDESFLLEAAQVREILDLRGPRPDDINRFIDKIEMKSYLTAADIKLPNYAVFDKNRYSKNRNDYLDDIDKKLAYPHLVKPVNLYGGIEVQKLLNRERFEVWAEKASHNPVSFEVDEFIEGKLYHIDSIILNGEINRIVISEYNLPTMLFAEGHPIGSMMMLKSDQRWQRFADWNQLIIDHFKPPDGTTHLEFFENDSGEIIFLEIAARPPGAKLAYTYEKTYGLNIELAHFMAQLGMPIDVRDEVVGDYYIWIYLPRKDGRIERLNEPPIKSLYTIDWYVSVGDVTNASKDMVKKSELSGVMFAHNSNYNELQEDFYNLKEFDATEVSKVK